MLVGDECSDSTGSDSIHALYPTESRGSDVPLDAFPLVRVSLLRGERAICPSLLELSAVTRDWIVDVMRLE